MCMVTNAKIYPLKAAWRTSVTRTYIRRPTRLTTHAAFPPQRTHRFRLNSSEILSGTLATLSIVFRNNTLQGPNRVLLHRASHRYRYRLQAQYASHTHS